MQENLILFPEVMMTCKMNTRCLKHLFARRYSNSLFQTAGKFSPGTGVSVKTPHASMVTIHGLKDATDEQKELIRWLEQAEKRKFKLPTVLTLRNLEILSEICTQRGKLKYLKCLNESKFINAEQKAKKKQEKERKKAIKEILELQTEQTNLRYGVWRNSCYLKLYPKCVNMHYNLQTLQNYSLAPNVVIDCDFDSFMGHKEAKSLAHQILHASISNKRSEFASNLHLCNVDKNSKYYGHLKDVMLNLEDCTLPLYLHEKSYLDIFPKNKIVYLTPNAECEMDSLDVDNVYVIGGIVDSNITPITVKKAQLENLCMRRLPLDKYLKFKGRKALNVNTVVDMLNTLQISNDWNEALNHIPVRLIKEKE